MESFPGPTARVVIARLAVAYVFTARIGSDRLLP